MSSERDNFREFGKNFRAFLEGFLNITQDSGTEKDRDVYSFGEAERKIADFPVAGIDGFLSHFVLTLQFHEGEKRGQLIHLTLPSAVQTVVRSHPFVYRGKSANHSVQFALPKDSTLIRTITESDFFVTPPAFFEENKEVIWLQILNLDARADTPIGPIRAILGETFKREYPDLYQPSFGAAQSLGRSGLPAKLFFSPNAIFETPFGALKTRPKALLGTNITSIPPVGSSPSLLEAVPLDSIDNLRAEAAGKLAGPLSPVASIQALAHPIDALLFGEDVFSSVERTIAS